MHIPLTYRKSQLLPAGLLLVLFSFTAGWVAHLAGATGSESQLTAIQRLVLVLSDVLRFCFFIGVAATLIGLMRNRSWKRQDEELAKKKREEFDE